MRPMTFTSPLAEELAEDVLDRFLRYVRVDTQSARDREGTPSTPGQLDLSRMLVEELEEMGIEDAELDGHGYVYATIPGEAEAPVVGLLAHVDTSPDAPGAGVEPIVHRNYDGGRDRAAAPRRRCSTRPSCRCWPARRATTSSPPAATRCSAPTTRPASRRSWPPPPTWSPTPSCRGRR